MTHIRAETHGTRRDAASQLSGVMAAPGRERRRTEFPAGVVVAMSIAVHALAAAVVYHDLIRDLYVLFDAAPRLLVLERGLARLTAASVFLPPPVPTALLGAAALWLGRARRNPEVARWLALATVPLAIDGVLRAVGVMIAPAPVNVGDLLDLPTRFSLGPRLVLDLLDVQPPAGLAYWVVVCTGAAAVSAWCVARAVLAAEIAQRDATRRHRQRGVATMDALRVGVATAGTWLGLAFAGQVALPVATQLFLQAFG